MGESSFWTPKSADFQAPAGRNAPVRNRATKSAELQAELAIGALRNAPERPGRIWGPKWAELQAGLAIGTLRNAPGRPGRVWGPKSTGHYRGTGSEVSKMLIPKPLFY